MCAKNDAFIAHFRYTHILAALFRALAVYLYLMSYAPYYRLDMLIISWPKIYRMLLEEPSKGAADALKRHRNRI